MTVTLRSYPFSSKNTIRNQNCVYFIMRIYYKTRLHYLTKVQESMFPKAICLLLPGDDILKEELVYNNRTCLQLIVVLLSDVAQKRHIPWKAALQNGRTKLPATASTDLLFPLLPFIANQQLAIYFVIIVNFQSLLGSGLRLKWKENTYLLRHYYILLKF